MSPLGDRVAIGRTAEVFAHGPDRVVKLYFDAIEDAFIDTEAHNCERAFQAGATPIQCHGEGSWDGRRGLVFDALHGDSLTRKAEKNLLHLRQSGRLLAREHAALHACDGRGFDEVRHVTASLLDAPQLTALTGAHRDEARRRLGALPEGGALLHMDFHTENVFVHDGGCAVIDWQTPLRGAPAADVACTMFLLAEAELWPGLPVWRQLLYNTVRRILRGGYWAEYRRLTGMTGDQVDAWRLPALLTRRVRWDIEGERDRLEAEIVRLLESR